MSAEDWTAQAVRGYLTAIGTYIDAVKAENPHLTLEQVLRRWDVVDFIATQSSEAQALVIDQLARAWAPLAEDATYMNLHADVHRAYEHTTTLRKQLLEARSPWDGAEHYARVTALRNSMTVQYAARHAQMLAMLQAGEEGHLKTWKARVGNPTCCHWCRKLHNRTIPVHDDFKPYLGGPVDLSGHGRLTQPPKAYLGKLQAPPLHPHCHCDLVVVAAGQGEDVLSGQGPGGSTALSFLASSDVRAMSAPRYRLLIEYLRAAAHELGLVLRRLQG